MKKNFITALSMLITTVIFAQDINLTQFANGFSNPVDIQNAGDDRLFIVEQSGIIKILNADGTTNATPYLNITSLVSSGGEQGLLGLAFHPDYSTNGYFFVHYSDNSGDTQISRFSVDGSNPDIADPSSELDILNVSQPFGNHNGGTIAFGSDDFLYIGLGDGGSGGDPGNRAQNTTLLLGKLLRIDIDNPSNGNNYGIPADNPFAGSTSEAEEIWAYGLRNPFRFSFDSDTGDVWIGDVGQNAWEEINKAGPAEAGLNYGWRCYEGNETFNTSNCPDPSTLTFPIAVYANSPGSSVTGGYVYRGTDFPGLQGYYFYADFGTAIIGTIDAAGVQNNLGSFGANWSAFGEDVNNELYILSYGGQVFRIEEDVAGTNDFKALNLTISPNPASQAINLEFDNNIMTAIEIYNILGSRVISKNDLSTSAHEVDIQSLTSGMYLVKVTGEKGAVTKKLIVK